jgi:hypothetical protein
VDLLQNLRLKPDSDKPKPGKLEYADIPITTKAGSRFCHPHPRPLPSKEGRELPICYSFRTFFNSSVNAGTIWKRSPTIPKSA